MDGWTKVQSCGGLTAVVMVSVDGWESSLNVKMDVWKVKVYVFYEVKMKILGPRANRLSVCECVHEWANRKAQGPDGSKGLMPVVGELLMAQTMGGAMLEV